MAGSLCIVLLHCPAAFLFLLFLVLCACCEGNLFGCSANLVTIFLMSRKQIWRIWSSLPAFWFFCNVHSWIPGHTWCGCWCSIYGFISLNPKPYNGLCMRLRSNSACWAMLWSLFYYRVLWMEVWTLPTVRRGLRVLAKRTGVWMLKLTANTSWVVTLLTTWRFSFSLSKLPWLHLALLLGEFFYKLYCPSPQESLQRQQYWFSLGGWATGFEGGRAWKIPSHFSGLLKEGLEADDLAEMCACGHSCWPNCPANWEECSYWEENVSCFLLI